MTDVTKQMRKIAVMHTDLDNAVFQALKGLDQEAAMGFFHEYNRASKNLAELIIQLASVLGADLDEE